MSKTYLYESALVLESSFGQCAPTIRAHKLVKSLRDSACRELGIDPKAASVTLRLIKKEYTEPIRKHVRKVDALWEAHTVLIGQTRFLPTANFERFSKEWTDWFNEFVRLKEDFLNRYDEEILPASQALFRHRDTGELLLDSDKWPTFDKVKERIHCSTSTRPFGAVDHIKNLKHLDEQAKVKMEVEARAEQATLTAAYHDKLRSTLGDVLGKFYEKMRDYDPEQGRLGEAAGGGNVRETVTNLGHLMVTEDPELEDLLKDAAEAASFDVDVLKASPLARDEAMAKAKDVLDRLGAAPAPAPVNDTDSAPVTEETSPVTPEAEAEADEEPTPAPASTPDAEDIASLMSF